MISQKAKLHNRFDFEIYDTETGKIEYAQAENIVLDKMWTYLCTGGTNSQFFKYIGVGTGTGTLSPARTTMFSFLASKVVTDVETVYDTDKTAHRTCKIVFTEIEAIGTWTEVGIFQGSSSSTLVTHAQLKDSEGNNITINKTNTKIVTVYATVFASITDPTVSGNYALYNGSNNLILRRLLGSAIANETPVVKFSQLKTADNEPSKIFIHTKVTGSSWTADAANKRMYSNLIRLASGSGNRPIRGVIASGYTLEDEVAIGYGGATLPVDGVFTSHIYTGVAVGTGNGSNKQFDLPLSFADPNSETIYVGGVAKTRGTDYAVHYGAKSTDTMLVEHIPYTTSNMFTSTIEEVVQLPQPSGGEATITSIELKNGASSYSAGGYEVSLSLDGTTWVSAGSAASGWSPNVVVTLNGFTPGAYKFAKFKIIKGIYGIFGIGYIKIFATPPATKHINFTSAPGSGVAITADFSASYINKTSNFVLDIQAEMVFGEGA